MIVTWKFRNKNLSKFLILLLTDAKDPDFKLEAVVILFRHGDRGPLNHIGHRNVSHINCEAKSPEFEQLSKFVSDTLIKLPGYSQFIGPFHSFPKVPSSPFCSLGQLISNLLIVSNY